MSDKFNRWAAFALKLSACAPLLALCWLFLHPTIQIRNASIEKDVHTLSGATKGALDGVKGDVHAFAEDLHDTANGINSAVSNVGGTAEILNAALIDKHDGIAPILHETHDGIRQSRHLVDVALDTSLAERTSFATASSQFIDLLKAVDNGVQSVANDADDLTDHVDASFANLNSLLEGPVTGTLANADQITGTAAHTLKLFDGKVQAWAHPTRRQQILDIGWAALGLARDVTEIHYYAAGPAQSVSVVNAVKSRAKKKPSPLQ